MPSLEKSIVGVLGVRVLRVAGNSVEVSLLCLDSSTLQCLVEYGPHDLQQGADLACTGWRVMIPVTCETNGGGK